MFGAHVAGLVDANTEAVAVKDIRDQQVLNTVAEIHSVTCYALGKDALDRDAFDDGRLIRRVLSKQWAWGQQTGDRAERRFAAART